MLQAKLRRRLSFLSHLQGRHWRSFLHRDYYRDPRGGLAGDAEVQARREPLIPLLRHAAGCSLLDLGCAEGLMLPPFLKAGARSVLGVDRSPRRIASARRLVPDARADFAVVDLTDRAFAEGEGVLAERYDIVLFLGVYQHLQPRRRQLVLRRALARTGRFLALRTPRELHREVCAVAAEAGFAPLRLPRPKAGPVIFFAPREKAA